jgi:carbonic anhydrase
MRYRIFKISIALMLPALATFAGVGSTTNQVVTPEVALRELKEGNEHHVRHQYKHPHETLKRQRELTSAQHPRVEILSCSDSRVPPEIIFDQGLGDLFVIRVAGNVASAIELGSLEYGALHLHIPLLVVLGHEGCGAVTAAVEGGEHEGHINEVVDLIKPAVEKSRGLPGDPVTVAVRTNVEMVINQLRTSTPVLSELVKQGKLRIVGGIYSLKTGRVTWLPETS